MTEIIRSYRHKLDHVHERSTFYNFYNQHPDWVPTFKVGDRVRLILKPLETMKILWVNEAKMMYRCEYFDGNRVSHVLRHLDVYEDQIELIGE